MRDDGQGFGARLRAGRQAAGLSQEELAERSGLSVRAVSNLERGRARWPHRETLRRLADALGLRDTARAEFIAAAGRRLAADTGAGPARGESHRADSGRLVPRQLPAPVSGYAGRERELAALAGLAAGDPASARVLVISGTAGVGKTALALYWSQQAAGRFPDGQLFVNLRGFYPSGEPVAPGEAILGFLDALEVPAGRIPAGLAAQAGLYRSMLSGKRMLVVLDNARDADQVRPLLPGGPGCLVLVTSRSQLAGLVAAQGAQPLCLDVLPGPQARALLAARLGRGRAAAGSAVTGDLAELCAGLPLALGIVASRALTRPGWPLAEIAAGLRDARGRLDMLDAGDAVTAVKAAFSWSYRQLSEPAALMFRLLGIHPGPDISLRAAASLAGFPLGQARTALGELAGASLAAEQVPGRFALHDLMRAYAAGLCEESHSAQERRAALHRVLDHYLHTGNAAATLSPVIFTVPLPDPGTPAAGVIPEDIADPAHALAWFKAEHRVLIAAAIRAADGFDAHAMQLPLILHPYLCRRGHWHDSIATELLALAAARRLGDLAGQGHAHCHLGTTYTSLGNLAEAEPHLRQALALYQRIDHSHGQGVTHTGLEVLRHRQQRDTDALYHAEQALKQHRIAGDRQGEANGLNNVGWCHVLQGDPGKGIPFLERAIDLLRETGHRLGLAYATDSLGYARHLLGEHRQAIACLQEAETLARELGDRPLQAAVLDHLGDACHAAADPQAARRAWRKALDIYLGLDHHDTASLRAKLAGSTQAASTKRRSPLDQEP
jgi:transcriptional regulator with XRE-family HTH domain/tetratricopeptide (TPR) repeat protein